MFVWWTCISIPIEAIWGLLRLKLFIFEGVCVVWEALSGSDHVMIVVMNYDNTMSNYSLACVIYIAWMSHCHHTEQRLVMVLLLTSLMIYCIHDILIKADNPTFGLFYLHCQNDILCHYRKVWRLQTSKMNDWLYF